MQSLPLPTVLLISSAGSSRANALGEQSCTLCLSLLVAPDSCRSLDSLKQLFPDLPGFKQETVVPTPWHLQWRIKEAFTSYHCCNSCSFKGCPAGCSSQPHPAQHLQAEIKFPPLQGIFPSLGIQTLLPFSPGFCQHPNPPAGQAHLRLLSNS